MHALNGLAHDVDAVVLGRALGGEGEHRHARLPAKQGRGGICRRDSDAGEVGGRGLSRDGAVGQAQHGALRPLKAGDVCNAEARGRADALGQADKARGREDHVAGGVVFARGHAVDQAGGQCDHAAVHRIFGLAHQGLLAVGLAVLCEELGGQLTAVVLDGVVKELKALKRDALLGGQGANLLFGADEHGRAHALLHNARGRAQDVGVVRLGEADALGRELGTLDHLLEKIVHGGPFLAVGFEKGPGALSHWDSGAASTCVFVCARGVRACRAPVLRGAAVGHPGRESTRQPAARAPRHARQRYSSSRPATNSTASPTVLQRLNCM